MRSDLILSLDQLVKLNEKRLRNIRKRVLIEMSIINHRGFCEECRDFHPLDESATEKQRRDYRPLKEYITDIDIALRRVK